MPVPFAGETFTFHNPDGSEVQVRGWGNQFEAVFETLDGYTVVKDPDTGFLHYATLSADLSTLVPTAERVGDADPERLGAARHLRAPQATSRARAAQAMDAMEAGASRPRWKIRNEQRRAQARRQADPSAGPEADAEAEPLPAGTVGDYRGLCLLVQFPDVPGTITQAEVSDFCNKPGYTGFGNNGSVHDYFLAVSDGKLRYTNQVTAYYTTQHPRAHYTDPTIPIGTRARELIVEALDHLRTTGFDFSGLTADGGQFVYALNVYYAGTRVNNWSEGLWPHAWTLAAPYVASPTRKFSDYQITDLGTQLTLRTFCHENGHMVCDFPDLYDYGSEGNGVGHYCLMCFGASNTNPAQVSAYLKDVAGWTSSMSNLGAGTTATLTAGVNDFLIHRKNANEYFILENRQRTGRDTALPDAGVAIWHVDRLGSNNNEQMTPTQHYELSLEQADGRFDLERRANGGDVEDLYGSPTATRFGTATAPASTWWDGTNSGLEIVDVSAPGTTMTISTQGEVNGMASVVGTWPVVAVDWGAKGSVVKAGPFTFKADGTWSYAFGGGRWIQVDSTAFWTFTNAPGLVYTATVHADAMSGVMGYASSPPNPGSGCFYALRAPSPAPEAAEPDTADAADPAVGL
jgi:M6 family metalloprotease-like protein